MSSVSSRLHSLINPRLSILYRSGLASVGRRNTPSELLLKSYSSDMTNALWQGLPGNLHRPAESTRPYQGAKQGRSSYLTIATSEERLPARFTTPSESMPPSKACLDPSLSVVIHRIVLVVKREKEPPISPYLRRLWLGRLPWKLLSWATSAQWCSSMAWNTWKWLKCYGQQQDRRRTRNWSRARLRKWSCIVHQNVKEFCRPCAQLGR